MYDSLLFTYPNRTDLWSVYIDMLVKYDRKNEARYLVILYRNHIKLKEKKRGDRREERSVHVKWLIIFLFLGVFLIVLYN